MGISSGQVRWDADVQSPRATSVVPVEGSLCGLRLRPKLPGASPPGYDCGTIRGNGTLSLITRTPSWGTAPAAGHDSRALSLIDRLIRRLHSPTVRRVVAVTAPANTCSKALAAPTSLSRAVTAIVNVCAASFAWEFFPSCWRTPISRLRTPSPFFQGDRLATPKIPSVCTLHR